MSLLLALALQAARSIAAQPTPPAPEPGTPAAVVAATPAAEWVTIAPDDLLVMDLVPDAAGRPRRVVIQLLPPPFSRPWVANVRTLARAHWWDGLSVNRVQDNYVAQWGDPNSDDKAKAKALPAGLLKGTEQEYRYPSAGFPNGFRFHQEELWQGPVATPTLDPNPSFRDDVPGNTDVFNKGFAFSTVLTPHYSEAYPIHCYGMVGVGRNLSPDTGTGAELYTVIGTPPRQLDRNIALVGRVVEGIENLSSLPRGTGALGFYQTATERTPIARVRLASDLPMTDRPALQYLSTESPSFARYATLRANRHDSFYIRPAGGVDVCNVPVPIRRVP